MLFSGQDEFGALFDAAATVSLSTLALLIVFKGLAWSISLGSFRGGPTFPALFLGAVAGLIAGHLPGYSETAGGGRAPGRGVRGGPQAPALVGADRQPSSRRRPGSG